MQLKQLKLDPSLSLRMTRTNMKNTKINLKQNEEKVVPFIWINPSRDSGHVFDSEANANMDGENSNLHIVGLFLGTGDASVVFNTAITHIAKNTKSKTTIRGVFLNNSSFSNDGLIKIKKGAKNADGYFTSKILLFDNAKGRSVPSLEIDENELKAGHASTVGRPDQDQLFYMKSRGLSEKEAERLIIEGFFDPVFRLLPDDLRKKT